MSWQTDLQNVITDAQTLCDHLRLDPAELNLPIKPTHGFPIRVPRAFVARMQPGDPSDPLLRQILMTASEDQQVPGYTHDPLHEAQANHTPGLLHKYHDRVLIMPAQHCPVHCRYCFRRHFPYDNNTLSTKQWPQWWSYLKNHPEVKEVILSGSDPLMLKDSMLISLVDAISQCPTIERIRIHTRFPIVIPSRLTETLKHSCAQHQIAMVLHCNHPQELIDDDLQHRLQAYRQAGVMLLNQSVLLKGVNDDADTLIALSEQLWQAGVMPYYLHLPDRIAGTAHFDVPDQQAMALHQTLQQRLAGYLVPKMVREDAAYKHKVLVH